MRTILHLILAVLLFPRQIPKLLLLAQRILTAMTGNPRFTNPSPPLAELSARIDDCDRAQTVSLTRARGTAQERDEKARALKGVLKRLLPYVQGIADATPSEAEAIILGAGMSIKRAAVHHKPDFEVIQGKQSGEVVLKVRRVAARASYDWQYGTDQKTWSNLPSTLRAKTVVSGLTPGTTYSFRFRALTKQGTGDWSQILTFLVK